MKRLILLILFLACTYAQISCLIWIKFNITDMYLMYNAAIVSVVFFGVMYTLILFGLKEEDK